LGELKEIPGIRRRKIDATVAAAAAEVVVPKRRVKAV